MKDHDPFADAELANPFSHFRDDPRSFVTKNTRGGVGASSDLFEVGPADSAGVDSNQNLPRPDFRHRNFFHAHIVHATVHRGAHRGRNLVPFTFNG
jgi:hypothetical protein